MKKTMIIMLFIAGLTSAMKGNNVINVQASNGVPGDTIELSAELNNSDNNIVAAEIIIPLSDGIKYVNGSALINPLRSSGHQIMASQSNEDLRIYIFSLGLQSIQGSSGELLTCKLVLGKDPKIQDITPNVILSDANGNELASSSTNATVTIIASKMLIGTNMIDYGHVPIRSSYHQDLVILNDGTAPLVIDSIIFSSDKFSENQLPLTIPIGSISSIDIAFNPDERGAVSEKLVIYSNAANGQFKAINTVALTADPFSVNELHFGEASGICDDTVEVHLSMNNMEPIVAGEISFKVPYTMEAVTNGFTLSDRATDHIHFSHLHGDTLTLYFYSPTNSPLLADNGDIGIVRLKLNGVTGGFYLYPIGVKLVNANEENMLSQAYESIVWIQSAQIGIPSNASFGTCSILDTASTSIAINNSGPVDLIIDKVLFLAEGYICSTELPLVVHPSQSESLKINYLPTIEGNFGTTMQVYSNDPDERMRSVSLSGNVFEPNILYINGSKEGSNYKIAIALDNYSDLSALQFDVKGIPNSAAMTTAPRLSSHSVMQSQISDGVRIIAFSMTNTIISGHSGEILNFEFPISGLDSIHIVIDGIMLSSINGTNKATQDSIKFDDEIKYSVVFANYNDSILQSSEMALGSIPTYSGGTPSKPSNVQYTYDFKGWLPAISLVQNDIIYIADYDSIINEYVITFENYDGTILQQSNWQYGIVPAYSAATPTKPSNIQYTYSFKGWKEAIVPVVGIATYTADFDSMLNEYSITFVNFDGTILQQSSWQYGTIPTYLGTTPTKQSNSQYTYMYKGWDRPLEPVSCDTLYIAMYDSVLNEYVITFENYDGTILQQSSWQYGTTPFYSGNTPNKPSNAQYTYTFKGWDKTISSVIGMETYIADYDSIVNEYVITFENFDGTILQQSSWQYGTVPVYSGITPTKPLNIQYSYIFKGWDKAISSVVETTTYIADYDSILNEYTITFVNFDGTILQQSNCQYGTIPVYSEPIPVKPSTNEYEFIFVGWTPSLAPVTGPSTYIADYDSALVEYTVSVTYSTQCGSITGEGTYHYLDEAILTATAFSGWEFSGWEDGSIDNPRYVTVTGNMNLLAFFTPKEGVNDAESVVKFAVDNKVLYVSLDSEDTICIFSINGAIIDERKAISYQKELTTGVYVLMIGDKAYKLLVK